MLSISAWNCVFIKCSHLRRSVQSSKSLNEHITTISSRWDTSKHKLAYVLISVQFTKQCLLSSRKTEKEKEKLPRTSWESHDCLTKAVRWRWNVTGSGASFAVSLSFNEKFPSCRTGRACRSSFCLLHNHWQAWTTGPTFKQHLHEWSLAATTCLLWTRFKLKLYEASE